MRQNEGNELLDKLDTLSGRISGLADAQKTAANNDVLSLRTYLFDSAGVATDSWQVDFRAVAVYSLSSYPIGIDPQGPQISRPATGAGVFRLPAKGFACFNVSGRALTLYGQPGDVVTVAVFVKPQPPSAAQTGPQPQWLADSLQNSNTVAAPTAGAAIAVTGVATGLFQISCQCLYTGTGTPVDTVETGNMRLQIGTTGKYRILVPPALNVPTDIPLGCYRANGQTIGIYNILAASANVNYSATIIATQIAA